jgi:hypothetical protein
MTTTETMMTTEQVAARFNELAQQDKWFDIQDELFAENVRSIDPPHSPFFKNEEGKANVRKKGENFLKDKEEFHGGYTSRPIVAGNFFAVSRGVDLTHKKYGRVKLDEIMLYEVKDGMIVLEQFFY